MTKKLILVLTSFLLLGNSVFAVEKSQIYMPYPIIFVSGIRTTETSPSTAWPSTKVFKEFKKYFLTDLESLIPKYEYQETKSNKLKLNERPHLEFFFYDSKEAPVGANAFLLKEEVEKILSEKGGYYNSDKYVYTEPCPTPKVILICHSYGCIITRWMLANNIGKIRDKVAAVFFLGAPQLGSPIAVIGYFLPKEIPYLMEDVRNIDDTLRKEDFTDRIWDEINFKLVRKYERQKLIGNLKFIKWAESQEGLYTSVRDIFDNAAIENAIADDYQLLALYREIPPVYQKGVIWATIIPDAEANTYRKKFELFNPANPDKPFVRYIPPEEDDALSYDLSKSVLSTLGTDIGVEKVHAIVGTRDDPIRDYLCGKADGYMAGHFDRLDYSCIKNDFWKDGDGVISLASQKAIPGAESPNTHVIDAAHVSFLSPILLTGEVDHPATPNIILQAIDDKPVIESVRFVLTGDPNWWTKDPNHPGVYIVVKVKDYLLADIEILEAAIPLLNLTWGYNDFNEFYDPEAKKYKPYFKFEKDFLKERIDEKAPIFGKGGSISYLHLEPGEFYIKASWLIWYTTQEGGESLRGRIKIKNAAQKETSCEIFYVAPSNGISINKAGSAYGNTRVNPDITYSLVRQQAYNNFLANSSTGPSRALGFWMYATGWYYYIFEYIEGRQYRYDYFHADISAGRSSQTGFDKIDVGSNKRIKSVQAYLRIDKWGDLPDFNASISRGNSFLFNLNSADYEDSYFSNYFIIGLDPSILDEGNNWVINKPDFFEDNYIPVSPDYSSSIVAHHRGFSIDPLLIIVSEDKEQEEVKQ